MNMILLSRQESYVPMWVAIPDESSVWNITSNDHEASFKLVYESISCNLPLIHDFMDTSLSWPLIKNYQNKKSLLQITRKRENSSCFFIKWHFYLSIFKSLLEIYWINHLSYEISNNWRKTQQNAFTVSYTKEFSIHFLPELRF